VFGRRAGLGASEYCDKVEGARSSIRATDVDNAASAALAPFNDSGGENPYTVHTELQQTMNDLVGIIRNADEMQSALERLDVLRERAAAVTVEGHRQFNPGWHLALDLENMLLVSRCVAKAALMREESRGGHTRDDFPAMSAEWRQANLICRASGSDVTVNKQPLPVMPVELLSLFDREELSKYLTEPELSVLAKGES
jgi:succinate dehydrogenase / fumarate reductase flavoprotein subunit